MNCWSSLHRNATCHVVLCCVVMCRVVLCCVALCRVVMCRVVLCCVVMCRVKRHCAKGELSWLSGVKATVPQR